MNITFMISYVQYSGFIYYYASLSHVLKEINKDLRLQLTVVRHQMIDPHDLLIQ